MRILFYMHIIRLDADRAFRDRVTILKFILLYCNMYNLSE